MRNKIVLLRDIDLESKWMWQWIFNMFMMMMHHLWWLIPHYSLLTLPITVILLRHHQSIGRVWSVNVWIRWSCSRDWLLVWQWWLWSSFIWVVLWLFVLHLFLVHLLIMLSLMYYLSKFPIRVSLVVLEQCLIKVWWSAHYALVIRVFFV